MSKAFTRENDDRPERPSAPRSPSALPPGAVNYVTPAGAKRLREDLEQMVNVQRPQLASAADEASQRKLRELDERIRHRQQSLLAAVVVPAPAGPEDRVRFGATVTVRDRSGESQYRIVGVDEADVDRGWISWLSPLAKALLNAAVGQRVRFHGPGGDAELEIVRVVYE